ncbi:MAG: chitobiase/beta-hexosaminidase C-terminal domain-containing protein, partial [Akkermansiaceae bacterium]|nr:chitobiase/beta-hexosaminidase C-terminal domain-containing protein [Akkermansiaceae bacterium]
LVMASQAWNTETERKVFSNLLQYASTIFEDEDNNSISPTSGTGTSLREAINYALTQATPQTITFSSNLAGQTIVLSIVGANLWGPNAFRISDTADITIQGLSTSPGITLSGGGALRLFMIDEAVAGVNPKLTLNDLTLVQGSASFGGAIFNTGRLVVNRCTFTGNGSNSQGGAIYTGASWAPTSTALLSNSTFSGNTAVVAGAVFADGTVSLDHVTISGNSSNVEGALRMTTRGIATLTNSIVAGNSRNITGNLQAGSRNNLIDSMDAGGLVHGVNGNLVNVASSGLQALASNGGPTRTMALISTSPAVNAAQPAPALATDQRGISRPQGAAPDMGAFEFVTMPEAAAPSISPSGGIMNHAPLISLSTTSVDAIMRYTLDGSAPSPTEGTVYEGPFTLSSSATVRAIAYGPGWTPSQVVSATFTLLTPLQAWRSLHGLAADGSQDLAHPSGDGVANLLKYAFNMAPNAGDLVQPQTGILPEGGTAGLPRIRRDESGRLTVTFIRRKAATNPGITYTVETGDHLDALQPLSLNEAVVQSIDATWEQVRVTDPESSHRRFGRVKITSDPAP